MARALALPFGPGWLIAAQAAALWPHWLWVARRAGDGSDEPWGFLALVLLALLLWRDRRRLSDTPPAAALLAAAGLTLAAALGRGWLPSLLAAGLGVAGLTALLAGLLPRERPRLALLLLALMSLPLTASANFYLGYPLRALAAQGSAALLSLVGMGVTPEGAALLWNGKTVLVDAPCAGVAMLWLGVFVALLLSYRGGASTARTLANLVGAVAMVLVANVIRNALLFFPEAGLLTLPAYAHEALGLLAFGLALAPVYRLAGGGRHG